MTKAIAAPWQCGSASDSGLQRGTNEDRVLADPGRGIFMVVDGMGGRAAGAVAAEAARDTIERSLNEPWSDPAQAIRRAIAQANNQIVALAEAHPEWRGMACVLTVAIAHEDRLTWGHVGDSRLYCLMGGFLRKLTLDHSPVGEQEDSGELDELAAMRHPRRNQVFRDVGSVRRTAADPDFVDTGSVAFPPSAAFLLCTDGLSDALTSQEIASILGRFDTDAEATARRLVNAANQRGGADNVSVIFVPGPEFQAARIEEQHAATRVRLPKPRKFFRTRNLVWLLLGVMLGLLLAFGWERPHDLRIAATSVFRMMP